MITLRDKVLTLPNKIRETLLNMLQGSGNCKKKNTHFKTCLKNILLCIK